MRACITSEANTSNLGFTKPRDKYMCFFCHTFISASGMFHYKKKNTCQSKKYYNEDNWLFCFDEIFNGNSFTIKPLLNILNSEEGEYKVSLKESFFLGIRALE
ncbi:hypothetical protein Mgra_00006121 [Meloidogyne graminicola]|uniref:Uncharacterized protein n=1 Tax=Meloidogyne graminicola TaxID=189291 RepID=A0A8S9ZML8_9BILA|nr:hypothetical protein Mgra_00006121 [Meloidogyne graminicola]